MHLFIFLSPLSPPAHMLNPLSRLFFFSPPLHGEKRRSPTHTHAETSKHPCVIRPPTKRACLAARTQLGVLRYGSNFHRATSQQPFDLAAPCQACFCVCVCLLLTCLIAAICSLRTSQRTRPYVRTICHGSACQVCALLLLITSSVSVVGGVFVSFFLRKCESFTVCVGPGNTLALFLTGSAQQSGALLP